MQITTSLPELRDHRLRLIHSGRLLTDGTLLYEWLKTLEERQERASTHSQEVTKEDHLVTWLHCSVGPKIEPGESDEEKPLVCWIIAFPLLYLMFLVPGCSTAATEGIRQTCGRRIL